MTPGSIRGVRKKSACRPTAAPGTLGRISRPFYLRSHATAALPRSLSINRFMQPPTPLHHLLFPPQGHPNAFPPPTTTRPRPFPPVVTALPPMASPAQQRQPSTTQSKGVIGPFTCICMKERNACTIHISELENHRKNTWRKRGCRCFAVAPPLPTPPAVAAFHRHFLLPPPPPGICVESVCNSLSLPRVYVATLHATFSTQANSSGNRKFEIEAPHHRSPSPPSSLFLPHHP